MQVSSVNNRLGYSFAGRNEAQKKKLNKKAVGKTLAATAAVVTAYTFATQRGRGGFLDAAVDKMQPAKDFLMGSLLKVLNRIRR